MNSLNSTQFTTQDLEGNHESRHPRQLASAEMENGRRGARLGFFVKTLNVPIASLLAVL